MGTLLKAARLTTAIALPLLSACGGEVISAGDVTVLVSQRATGGMDALGGGRIEVVGGCLGASGSVIVGPELPKLARTDK